MEKGVRRINETIGTEKKIDCLKNQGKIAIDSKAEGKGPIVIDC